MQNLLARFVALLVGVAIGVGGVVGALVLLHDDGATSRSQSTSESPNTSFHPRGDSTITADSIRTIGSVSIPDKIDDLVFPIHAFERKATILAWVSALSNDQILNWLEQSTDLSWSTSTANQHELRTALLQKLTITAPDKALTFAGQQDEQLGYSMTPTVFREWANTDLDGAIAHVKGLTKQESNYLFPIILEARPDLSLDRQRELAREFGNESYAFSNYFRSLVRGGVENPEETWYEIVNLANAESVQDTAGYALRRVAVDWVAKHGMGVLDEIVSTLHSGYSSALPNLLSALSEDKPKEIFDYVMNNLGDRANAIIQQSSILYHWARKDPKEMLARAETLPPSGARQRLVWQAVWHWAEDNPGEVLQQLDLIPQEHQEEAKRNAIRSYARTSPTEAAKYVLQISDSDSQLELATMFIQDWSYQDVDAAKNWVMNLSESNLLRNALIQPIALALVQTDPRAAFQLALERPLEENDSNYVYAISDESSILSMIAYQDVNLALELLPQVRERGKNFAYSTVGNSLIQRGDVAGALSLANQLSDEEQEGYYQRVSFAWAVQDPQGLLKAFDDFPTTEIQSRVALTICIRNSTTNTFTNEEIAGLEKYMNEDAREKLELYQKIDLSNPSPDDLKLINKIYSW